jgi:radical SAM superfamily enzyme YgiQ (UPF0313 family)
MKVLLINPGMKTDVQPPMGLIQLAAYLRQEKIPVRIIDFAVDDGGDSEENIEKRISETKADIVGILTFTDPTISKALKISEIAKKHGAITVWGGAHTSTLPELSLKHKDVDILVVGEGEYTMTELVRTLEKGGKLDNVNGIWFKKKGKLIKTPRRELIKDLDSLPLPAWDLVDIKKYIFNFFGRKAASIITSRGCPYRCVYCHNRIIFGRSWRGRSVEKIFEEIDLIKKLAPEVNALSIWDDLFTSNYKRVMDFCDELIRRKENIVWTCLVRANQVTEPLLKKMKQSGCINIYMGIESGSPRMLGVLKKDYKIEQIKNAMKIAKKFKMNTAVSFIMGSPSEKREDIDMSIKLAKEINPTICSFYFFKPYPGTEGYEIAKASGFKDPKTLEEWGQVGVYNYITPGISDLDDNILYHYRKKIFLNLKPVEIKNFILETLPKTTEKRKYMKNYIKMNMNLITKSNYSKRFKQKLRRTAE